MSVGAGILPYLIHTVQIIRGPTGEAGTGTGTDQWGTPLSPGATPGTIQSPARFEWDTRRMFDTSGQEVVAAGMVFLPNTVEIGPEDQIVFEGRAYKVIKRERCEGWGWTTDPRAHWEIWVA
jgi:hypothetical protein